jgi:aspartate aminotransferase-like enzyme
LYRSIEEKFLTLAGLSQDWELYLVTGSGTTGIEAVIASATQWVETLFVEPQSDFSVRLSDMVSEYNLCYLHAGDNVA